MRVDVAVQIDKPVADVFDAMADARNEPSWNTPVRATELLTEEPVGSGAQFRTVNRGQTYTVTVAEYNRPSLVRFVVAGKAMEITSVLRFAEAAGRTHLTGVFDMQPKGVMRLMLPLMGGAVRKDFPRQMANFKQFCESRPSS